MIFRTICRERPAVPERSCRYRADSRLQESGLEAVSEGKDCLRFIDIQERCAVERHPGLCVVEAQVRGQPPRDIVLAADGGRRFFLAFDATDMTFEREGQCARFPANAGRYIPTVRVRSARRKVFIAGARIDCRAAVDDLADNPEAPGIEP